MQEKDSIVELITHWSKEFNAPTRQTVGFPLKVDEKLAIKLIEEELAELKLAINQEKLVDILDGLGDLLWVVHRALLTYGVSAEDLIQIIYTSNMSKAVSTEELAQESIDELCLMENKLTGYCYKPNELYYDATEEGRFLIKRVEDGKVLKGILFEDPKSAIKSYIDANNTIQKD